MKRLNRSFAYLLTMLTVLAVLLVAQSARAEGPDVYDDGPAVSNQIYQIQKIVKRRTAIQGVMPTTARVMYTLDEPDGIEWANAFSNGYGYAWPANSPDSATDTEEECGEETTTMCEDSGNGGTENHEPELTDTEQGGCTCSQECDQNGAVAFISSDSPCGTTTIVDDPDPVGHDCFFNLDCTDPYSTVQQEN